MNSFLTLILALGLVATQPAMCSSLSSAESNCIAKFNETLSRDYLVGDWYKVYRFAFALTSIPSSSCSYVTYSIPTDAQVEEYKTYYGTDRPFEIGADPLMFNEDPWIDGMLSGSGEVKWFVLSPGHYMILGWNDYRAEAFRKIDDNYFIHQQCDHNGRWVWLMTRTPDASVEELNAIIAATPEIANMESQRYCAT